MKNLTVERGTHGNYILSGYYNGIFYKLNCWLTSKKEAVSSFKNYVKQQDSLNFYNEPII